MLVVADKIFPERTSFFGNAFLSTAADLLHRRPHFRFHNKWTLRYPVSLVNVLHQLRAFREIVEIATAGGLALRSGNLAVRVSSAFFELGDLHSAYETLKIWKNQLTSLVDAYRLYDAGLIFLMEEQEQIARELLSVACQRIPRLRCAHQNLSARFPADDYKPRRLDAEPGEMGLLYDAYNLIGQRVAHVGRGGRSADLYARALQIQDALREKLPAISSATQSFLDERQIGLAELRVLPYEWFTQIGHQFMIDILLRMRELGWWRGHLVFVVPPHVANSAAVSLLGTFGEVLLPGSAEYDDVAPDLISLQRYVGLSFNAFKLPGGDVVPWQEAGALAIRQWEAEKKTYPFRNEFDAYLASAGMIAEWVEKIREQWGMRPTDWYVCLHMRDPAYYGEVPGTGQTHRNADVKTYLSTIEHITKQGGWVIKLGGPGSVKLPKMDRVIDYAHSPFKSDLMDLVLIRSCRYFIGTTSGLTNVAVSFGIPCALVNCITTDAQLWGDRVRFIPKTVYVDRDRLISQAELTSAPWRWRMFSAEVLAHWNATAIDNQGDEILETIKQVEMLAAGKEDGYIRAFQEGADLIQYWRRSLSLPHFYGNAQAGVYFLQKHRAAFLGSNPLHSDKSDAEIDGKPESAILALEPQPRSVALG
jgi:putative glycosyltransferase (TIGR04372 family)